jgi:hypothetical protein
MLFNPFFCFFSGLKFAEVARVARAFVSPRYFDAPTARLGMRVGISEARRFPDLAISVHRMARQRAEETIRRVLGQVAQSGEHEMLPAFRPEHLVATAHMFVDLVVMPLVLRALFGEKRKSLQAEIESHVANSVGFFLAACRNSGHD